MSKLLGPLDPVKLQQSLAIDRLYARKLMLLDQQRAALVLRRTTLREYMRANLERDPEAMAMIAPGLQTGNVTRFYPVSGGSGHSSTNDLLRPYLSGDHDEIPTPDRPQP